MPAAAAEAPLLLLLFLLVVLLLLKKGSAASHSIPAPVHCLFGLGWPSLCMSAGRLVASYACTRHPALRCGQMLLPQGHHCSEGCHGAGNVQNRETCRLSTNFKHTGCRARPERALSPAVQSRRESWREPLGGLAAPCPECGGLAVAGLIPVGGALPAVCWSICLCGLLSQQEKGRQSCGHIVQDARGAVGPAFGRLSPQA